MSNDRGFDTRMARIETLTNTLDQTPDLKARASARELVGTLLDLHADGLARVVGLLTELGHERIVAKLGDDPQVARLLLLHGLHPEDLPTRLHRAIDETQARVLARTDSRIELVSLAGETARVRIVRAGGCGGGCPSSAASLRKTVQESLLEAVPDLEVVEFEDVPVAPSGSIFLPVITL